MSLSRHSSKIYLDEYDIDGVLKVLAERIGYMNCGTARDYHIGAHLALNLIRNHEEIRDQSVFMALFDNVINANEGESNEG